MRGLFEELTNNTKEAVYNFKKATKMVRGHKREKTLKEAEADSETGSEINQEEVSEEGGWGGSSRALSRSSPSGGGGGGVR